MALKFLYLVCEIKKLDLIFSSFSVRSQNHSYKNSIVFRLARHFVLKHITSYLASETLSGVTQLKIEDKTIKNQGYLFAGERAE